MRTYTLTTMVAMVGVILLYACSSSEASSPNKSTSNSSMTKAAISYSISSATSLAKPQKIYAIASMQKYLEIAALLRKENMCTQSS
jgi:hypothetical protein